MSQAIYPTVGRHVNYIGHDGHLRAAIVTKVHGASHVNLFIFGCDGGDGEHGHRHDVTHADIAVEPHTRDSWHWMPFQLGQAKAAT